MGTSLDPHLLYFQKYIGFRGGGYLVRVKAEFGAVHFTFREEIYHSSPKRNYYLRWKAPLWEKMFHYWMPEFQTAPDRYPIVRVLVPFWLITLAAASILLINKRTRTSHS